MSNCNGRYAQLDKTKIIIFIYLSGTNSIESANTVHNFDPMALGIMECSWVKGEDYKQSYNVMPSQICHNLLNNLPKVVERFCPYWQGVLYSLHIEAAP